MKKKSKRRSKNVKVFGIKISLTVIGFVVLLIFLKALSVYFEDWFNKNILVILIISTLLVIFFIAMGYIQIRNIWKDAKSRFI